MKNKFKLDVGDRIIFNEEIYEICYIEGEIVRYSNFISGVMHFINLRDLIEKILLGEIRLNSIKIPHIHSNHRIPLNQIHKYLSYIFSNNISCSKRCLELAIEDIINKYPDIERISTSTLARFIKNYRDNSDSFNNFYKKNEGNKVFRFSIEVEKIINEVINDIIKDQEYFNPRDAHLLIKNKILSLNKNEKIPSERTIYRRFQKLDPYVVTRSKKGKRHADKIFIASGQSQNSPGLMAIVEIDTHMIDVIILDTNGNILGRPYLCLIIEVYTRVIVGWHLCMLPPCTTKTLLALKNMLLRSSNGKMGGIPTKIIPDNGCEFNNNALNNFCYNFNITKTESQPYHPNDKPHVESFFRTLNHHVSHKIRGTTFSSPLDKGDYDSVGKACYSLNKLEDLVDNWIENIYHKTKHSGTEQRPEKMWQDAVKVFPLLQISEGEIETKCRTIFRYKISKGQINLKGLRFKSQALASIGYIFKEKVTIYVDQLNLNFIYVQDPFNKFNLIKAESVYPKATENLSLTEWLEAKKILREKYKIDPDEVKNEELLYLARLNFLLEIQSLNKVSRKIKQVKNDLPKMIKTLESNLHLVSSNTDQEIIIDHSENLSLAINSNSTVASPTTVEYFYEEIDLND